MFSIVYKKSMTAIGRHIPDKFQPFWNHSAGPQTVFFWAPLIKWGLVIAGLSDLTRPAEKLSIRQSGSLAATGFIWSRYSLVIIPRVYSLLWVNMFVGITQSVQLLRAYNYQRTLSPKVEDESK